MIWAKDSNMFVGGIINHLFLYEIRRNIAPGKAPP